MVSGNSTATPRSQREVLHFYFTKAEHWYHDGIAPFPLRCSCCNLVTRPTLSDRRRIFPATRDMPMPFGT